MNASDWRSVGLILFYTLTSAISAGYETDFRADAIDRLAKTVQLKDEIGLNLKHSLSSGTGGFLSSFGEAVLHSYDLKTDKWNTQVALRLMAGQNG